MNLSPYLTAIQALPGPTPGAKYKSLHWVAKQIVNSEIEKKQFIKSRNSERVQAALLPFLRILVGNLLKRDDFLLDALKSDDVSVIKQALSAKWFFQGINDLISVDYFYANIMPFISIRTRLELIKVLANCLVDEPRKAQEFFDCFTDLYGIEETLPLIVCCSPDYIFYSILKRRIILPSRILGILYRKHPDVTISYLQLGNTSNKENENHRRQHSIPLANYKSFLPILVKNHTAVFVELFKQVHARMRIVKLGNTRAELFIRNATDALIAEPRVFLDLLPYKLVCTKLNQQQFETMFENLFPRKVESFNVYSMAEYLKHYDESKRWALLKEKYSLKYGQDLEASDRLDIFQLKTLLTKGLREKLGREKLQALSDKPEYYDNLYVLPPAEAIPQLQERLSMPSEKLRIEYIKQMIDSCAFYESKDDLLKVCAYYIRRHKNEDGRVLGDFLGHLQSRFDLKTLPNKHWLKIKELLTLAHTRNDISPVTQHVFQSLFQHALHYYITKSETAPANVEAKEYLEKLLAMILKYYLEDNMRWNFIPAGTKIERECIQRFLEILPNTYPMTHPVWENFATKLYFVTYIVEAIHDFNLRNKFSRTARSKKKTKKGTTIVKDSEGKDVKHAKIELKNYYWLEKLVADVLTEKHKIGRSSHLFGAYLELRKTLREHDIELYQNFVDHNSTLLYDVENSDAVFILKRYPYKILSKWELYVDECKKLLSERRKSTKRFLKMSKWHQTIPIKYVERCVNQIKEPGSVLILGLLLEGDVLAELMKPYLPKENETMDIGKETAKEEYEMNKAVVKAFNCANPPVPFDAVIRYCQVDYVALGSHMLKCVSRRAPIDRVMWFAKKLLDNPAVSVKKLGIRLMFHSATRTDLTSCLTKIWDAEKNPSLREVLIQMIYKLFVNSPKQENWNLMKMCINNVTENDCTALTLLKDIKDIDQHFVSQYIAVFLKKLDEFPSRVVEDSTRTSIITAITSNINGNVALYIPDEQMTDLLKRQFFAHDKSFTFDTYLLHETNFIVDVNDETKFDKRLSTIIEILKEQVLRFDEPDRANPRKYPYRRKIRKFFSNLVDSLYYSEVEVTKKTEIIRQMLALFSSSLQPSQDPWSYVSLIIYREYFSTERNPATFGREIGNCLKDFVTDFGSEIILFTVVKVINGIWDRLEVRSEQDTDVLSFIDAMMTADKRLGSIVGIKMLSPFDIDIYGSKYDKLVKIWQEMNDATIQSELNDFFMKLICF